jgi:hypothetical protein
VHPIAGYIRSVLAFPPVERAGGQCPRLEILSTCPFIPTTLKSPQTNGICERFHKTVLNEFYRVAFRKTLYASIAEIQRDLDAWLE